MRLSDSIRGIFLFFLLGFVIIPIARSQQNPLQTPLKQEILDLLTDEISGQVIYNNLVKVAGAPWIRNEQEFTDTFYESATLYDLARSYGIENVRLDRYDSEREFDYPVDAELWLSSPELRLIAKLEADPALVARGSVSADIDAELIYIPPLNEKEAKVLVSPELNEKYRGKVALMWNHPRGELASVLDDAGIRGVISFSSRERYVDPNMVVYSSGSYSGHENLKFGMTISWRQWSELLEDIEYGEDIRVRCMTRIEQKDDKFETVFAWIPGKDADKKGIIFTAHLFEGYTKRGANDNAGGCLVQLEILRTLTELIKEGKIEQPMRNIYFLWPNEISGTYNFISNNAGVFERCGININMDMVTEGLRKNNSWLTMSETPAYRASFYDGLAYSVMNYVWRTNDIVYLPDSPRGRRGGQYFPKPMMEKNGSADAFRFYIHKATGGSDHICFNNPSVGIPGVEYFTWPDYWYHADTDTPDKGDPTQMKRIAFIGAASAYAAASCTDNILPGVLKEVSDYGYTRVGARELPEALNIVYSANPEDLRNATALALNLIDYALNREIMAVGSLSDFSSGSDKSTLLIKQRLTEWNNYEQALHKQIEEVAVSRAKQLGVKLNPMTIPLIADSRFNKIIPEISPEIKYRVFSNNSYQPYTDWLKANPETAAAEIASLREARTLVNCIDGKRSLGDIIRMTIAETGKELDPIKVEAYFSMLRETGFTR